MIIGLACCKTLLWKPIDEFKHKNTTKSLCLFIDVTIKKNSWEILSFLEHRYWVSVIIVNRHAQPQVRMSASRKRSVSAWERLTSWELWTVGVGRESGASWAVCKSQKLRRYQQHATITNMHHASNTNKQ